MKIHSISLVIKDMQIKIKMRFHHTPIRMATIKKKKTDNTKGWLTRIWNNWNCHTLLREMQNFAATLEGSVRFVHN